MEESIQVVCRIRPQNSKEAGLNLRKSVTVEGNAELIVDCKAEQSRNFVFDYVAGESTQQDEIFNQVGIPITEACLQGFNGTIICYGPTGTGKSFTIFGNSHDDASRGLVPRVLEYIFQYFGTTDNDGEYSAVSHTSKCSFYEIYQERVYDLLDGNNVSNSSLQVREDVKKGVFIDGITEEAVCSSTAASEILAKGYCNRHVGQTDMNRESSRSHAVFVLTLTSTYTQPNGTTKNRSSRFSLVDLAGSERQKDTQATGERLKEAGIINKSLSNLGNVINALSEKGSKMRHINYRDSKLTFLLRDSLGGNTKTVLIATLSPSTSCVDETLSTLKFAQRAKSISNIVVRNEETTGTVVALQREIESLKAQLLMVSSSTPCNASCESSNMDNDFSSCIKLHQQMTDQIGFALSSLAESSHRCQAADELRKRTESGNLALTARLDQSEKQLQTMEMKLKLRESEISRLKKSQSIQNESVASEDVSFEAVHSRLVETSAAKEKLQAELLKYRQAFEEIQRRLKLEPNANEPDLSSADISSIKSVLKAMWSPSDESLFQHDFLEKLECLQEAQREQTAHCNSLANREFLHLTGMTIAEAVSLKESLVSLSAELKATEQRHDGIEAQLRFELMESKDQQRRAEATHSSKLSEVQATETELRNSVSALQQEMAVKENLVSQLEELSRQREAERDQIQHQEAELKAQYLRAMKDNAVLIRSFQELENSYKLSQEKAAQQVTTIQGLETEMQSLTQVNTEQKRVDDLKIAELAEQMSSTSRQLEETRQVVDDMQLELVQRISNERELSTEIEQLTSQIRALEHTQSELQLERSVIEKENQQNADLIHKLENEREGMVVTMTSLEEKIRTLNDDVINANIQFTELNAKYLIESESLTSVNSQLQEELVLLEASMNNYVSVSRVELLDAKTKLEMVTAQYGQVVLELDEMKSQFSRADTEKSRLAHELSNAMNAMEQLRDQFVNEILAKSQELTNMANDVHTLTCDCEKHLMEIEAKQLQVSQLSLERDGYVDQLKKMEELQSTTTSDLSSAQQQIEILEKEVSTTQRMLVVTQEECAEAQKLCSNLTDENVLVGKELEDTHRQLSETRAQEQAYSVKLQDLAQELNEANAANERSLEVVTALQIQVKSLESQNHSAELEAVNHSLKSMSSLNDTLQTELISTKEGLCTAIAANKLLEDKLLNAESSITQLQSTADNCSEFERRCTEYSASVEDLQMQNANLQSQTKALTDKANAADSSNALLQARYSRLQEDFEELNKLNGELQEENGKLSGHHNNKQKIHQHMQLKKELMDQAGQIKQLRDQIIALTIERDAAVTEVNSLKEATVAASSDVPAVAPSQAVGVKTRAACKMLAETGTVRTKDLVANYTRKYLDQPATKKVPLAEVDVNLNGNGIQQKRGDVSL